MNIPSLNFHAGALVGVVIGGLLAMLSAIVGNQYESFSLRRERERTAALLFGEVFATVRILLEGAESSLGIGEPFGPFTRRLLASARREMNIYERNRESLVALHDPQLRSDIHNVALRIIMPLESLTDSFLADGAEPLGLDRRRVFNFMMDQARRIPGLTARLGRIARHSFEDYGEAVQLRAVNPPGAQDVST
jgi:hypothetical protein